MRRVGILLALGVLILTLTASMAVAGTGLGGVFNLGRTNAVNAISVLKGSTTSAMLRIANSGPGTALQLLVQPGKPPMTVNSDAKVSNLNADKLDGKSEADFLASAGKAADADNLDGRDSSAFLPSKIYFLSEDFTVPSNTIVDGTAECDSGDVLLSGGYEGASWMVPIHSSTPLQSSSGLVYLVRAENGLQGTRVITINITCADLSPENPVR